MVDGPSGDDGRLASWGFPVLAPELRRVYVFYTKNIGVVDVREDTTGLLAYKYSDDEGETWSERLSLPMERSAISPTDPGTPENWICYQTPILNPRGEVTAGFTRWAGTEYHSESHLFQRHSGVLVPAVREHPDGGRSGAAVGEHLAARAARDPGAEAGRSGAQHCAGASDPEPARRADDMPDADVDGVRVVVRLRGRRRIVVGGRGAAVRVGRAAGATSDFAVSAVPALGRTLPADLPQQHRDDERSRGSARLEAEPATGVVQHRSGAGWGGGAAAGVQRAADTDRQRRGWRCRRRIRRRWLPMGASWSTRDGPSGGIRTGSTTCWARS